MMNTIVSMLMSKCILHSILYGYGNNQSMCYYIWLDKDRKCQICFVIDWGRSEMQNSAYCRLRSTVWG